MRAWGWLATGIAVAAAGQPGPAPGADLRPGTRLVYRSGTSSSEWTIDSVALGVSFGAHSRCAEIVLRRGPPAPERRRLCAADSLFYAVDSTGSRATPSRPVEPGRSLELRRASGGSVRYRTGAAAVDTVGTVAVPVIETIVETVGADGRVVRRLRERFAPGLTTATWGTFEAPDSAGGWRTEQTFRLVAIRPPGA